MQMAELDLLPAVRNADKETLIVADGTSCRHQIADGTTRQAIHVAEVLLMALENGSGNNIVDPLDEQHTVNSDSRVTGQPAVGDAT